LFLKIIDNETISENDEVGWARAIYSYEAGEPDELSFQGGDLIKVLGQHESGWWTGELNGTRGLFPENYVEMTYEENI